MFFDNEMEIIHPDIPRGRFRSVLFDFDGTLSLIREGWPQVMIPMMVEVLRETGTAESEPELFVKVEEFVMRLCPNSVWARHSAKLRFASRENNHARTDTQSD